MIYSENILICIAVPLVVVLPFVQGHTRKSYIGLLLGMVMCLFAAYLNSFFAQCYDFDQINTAKYVSPIVEEIMKMIPVMIFALLVDHKKRDIKGFAVAVGAGFATFENCCYITVNGAKLISFILIRGLSVGIMHVLCGLVIGIGIELSVKYKSAMVPGTLGAFTFAMTIHALYNLLVSQSGISMYVGFVTPFAILILVYLSKDRLLVTSDE